MKCFLAEGMLSGLFVGDAEMKFEKMEVHIFHGKHVLAAFGRTDQVLHRAFET